MANKRVYILVILICFGFFQINRNFEISFSSLSPQIDKSEVDDPSLKETKKPQSPVEFLSLNLDKYQALIGERLCDIEVIEEGESIEIHFFDSSGETCDRYEKNRLTHVDMNQVADSTMPLFIKRNDRILPSREEEPVGLVQVADLINFVRQNQKVQEAVLIYPVGQEKSENL